MNPKTFGQILKKARLEKKLTQEQLSEIFGVTNRTISRWERGVNLPDYDTLLLISQYFQIPLNEILTGEKTNSPVKKKWYQRYYASMNQFRYHLTQFIFNIINIIVVTILYNHHAFGTKTINLSILYTDFFKQMILPELLFYIIPIVCTIIYTFKHKFQNIKNFDFHKIIHIELIVYHLIFIPIIIFLIGCQLYLYIYIPGSSFLIAFSCIFSNMVIFHYLYVMRLHRYVDRL